MVKFSFRRESADGRFAKYVFVYSKFFWYEFFESFLRFCEVLSELLRGIECSINEYLIKFVFIIFNWEKVRDSFMRKRGLRSGFLSRILFLV
jgi:hypothetical protein